MLNARGRRLFRAVLGKDEETVECLFSNIPVNKVRASRQTLQSLLNKLR